MVSVNVRRIVFWLAVVAMALLLWILLFGLGVSTHRGGG